MGRSASFGLLVVVLAAVAAGIAVLLEPGPGGAPAGRSAVRRPADARVGIPDEPAPPSGAAARLRGGGILPGDGEKGAGVGEAGKAERPAGPGTAAAPVGVSLLEGGDGTAVARPEDAPVAPGAVEDAVAAASLPPIRIARADLGEVRFAGVARIVREDRAATEAADDTETPPTTAIGGRVLDEEGAGIPGAEVILYSSFYLRQDYYDHRVREIGRAFTDRDGAFDLRPVDLDTVHFGRDGEVLVTVRHGAYADLVAQPLRGLVPGQESQVGPFVLPLQPATVRGRLRDLEGTPVAGAIVRASGAFNPVEYDKTERTVVLRDCPAAVTDEEGAYELTGFAAGIQEISIHVNIDCVLHVRGSWAGEREWSPMVRAGNEVRGRVVDPDGEPVAAAVVSGGGNWTPTNPDGTFWLDNVAEGPLVLQVSHHAWQTLTVPDIETNADEPTVLVLAQRLPRITLEVVDEAGGEVPLVRIDWRWGPGGPGAFTPDSPWWHDPNGRFTIIVPENAVGAIVSAPGGARAPLDANALADGAGPRAVLRKAP